MAFSLQLCCDEISKAFLRILSQPTSALIMNRTSFMLLAVMACSASPSPSYEADIKRVEVTRIFAQGKTLETRLAPLDGFHRTIADTNSFAHYLRQLPLKPHGSEVLLYNGSKKWNQDAHVAVVGMEIGKKNLQQCADACIRLWAEYLWKLGRYAEIQFLLTNGFKMEYTKWREGYRLKVVGNQTQWVKSAAPIIDYATFRAYLERVFTFAGTLSV